MGRVLNHGCGSLADRTVPRRFTRKGVHNRFGGMRDLAFFRGDIRDGNLKQGREAGISIASGSGISCFHGDGMRDRKGNRAGYGISIFT